MPTLRTIADLTTAGLIRDPAGLDAVAGRYAVAISPAMVALIDPADPADPVRLQFVPDVRELTTTPDELADPIGDEAHAPVTGVVHRHRDRVLLKLTGLCPVYCRFCFRREMIGPDAGRELAAAELDRALAYIAAHDEIGEVILTGGDPLILSPRRIGEVTRRLAAIPHVRVLRWHTRVPVVAPERVTDELVAALDAGDHAAVWIGVHANHAREITPAAIQALARLRRGGFSLVSQTVLLRGVNADLKSLTDLMWAFIAAGVKPYYLHHPDLAPGTGHFRVSIADGQRLVEALRGAVSGLAQPTYVLDIPGGVQKVAIGASMVSVADGEVRVRDSAGRTHVYGCKE